MRNRAGIILYCKSKKQLLFIKRICDNKSYWVAPGGGLKDGEDFEYAAKREFYEEMGTCVAQIIGEITLNLCTGTEKYYISVAQDTCEFVIHGEEAQRNNESNQYIPQWISVDDLNEINLLPLQLKNEVMNLICLNENE